MVHIHILIEINQLVYDSTNTTTKNAYHTHSTCKSFSFNQQLLVQRRLGQVVDGYSVVHRMEAVGATFQPVVIDIEDCGQLADK